MIGAILMTFIYLSNIVKVLKRKENVMPAIIHMVQKTTSSRQRLITILGIVFLCVTFVAIYIEIMTAQMIAPPGVRVLDFFWRTFHWLRV